MKINEILGGNRTTLSFEVFPPKTTDKIETVKNAVDAISKFKPDFMSVTYGAGGGANSNFTAALASHINNDLNITALAHLTCVSSDLQTIDQRLSEFKESGIENILALRGDLPLDGNSADMHFKHANELARYISERSFCVGGACYPEGHLESGSIDEDIEKLKLKVDAGCSFLTTQMFFDNNKFYTFREKLAKNGIDLPIIAGIMPIISAKQIKRSCELSGATMPKAFLDIVDRYGDDPASMYEAGLVYACAQIIDLLAHDTANIHVYVMNRAETAERIRHDLGNILPIHN